MKDQIQDKRQAILQATLELVAQNGLHNTPMAQVRKRAGVSAGAIYHYFESKEQLINELYLEVKEQINLVAFQGINSDLPYQERFLQMWHGAFEYFDQHIDVVSFVEQCSNSPVITDDTKQKVQAFHQGTFEFFQKGIHTQLLKPMSAELMMNLVYATMLSFIKLKHTSGIAVGKTEQQDAALFCWDGIVFRA